MKRYSKIPGKIKGLLLTTHIDIFVPERIFSFLVYMAKLSRWRKKHKTAGLTDFYNSRFEYNKRYTMFESIISQLNLDAAPLDYLEFGVSKGQSFRWWVDRLKNENVRFYGFDTFSGLPEDWGPFKAGEMDNGNKIPEIDDHRHQFFQGLFQQTLGPFLSTYQQKNRKIIHLDADLYSSTLFVLTTMAPYIQKGDILLFDEFNVPMHEFKAFIDWSSSFYINYKVLANVNNYYQVAILIE